MRDLSHIEGIGQISRDDPKKPGDVGTPWDVLARQHFAQYAGMTKEEMAAMAIGIDPHFVEPVAVTDDETENRALDAMTAITYEQSIKVDSALDSYRLAREQAERLAMLIDGPLIVSSDPDALSPNQKTALDAAFAADRERCQTRDALVTLLDRIDEEDT